ncbi:50S ribosomal protein L30 [Desulfobotulus sp.]|jgi:large subunit ribosomal protein L30|uniref:50S ribosomal protein L30 n=1 Tax=Desulfobotulus sp. TaxID=1940337 RepID=UPI002A361E50|nr:50S ribosomal protein L30 [Desulfobotulus sp.]MDY0163637.1 50S ribosomal protein L30 [Desulfobotulus sp.]
MGTKLSVQLVKSMVGKPEKQRKVLRAMGLTKMHKTVTFESNPATLGMINKVSHMVKVEEV